MTAKVAVFNTSGVALAADSAVTVGGKIYNSALKLFALSKTEPVGIMVYGSASLMGVPWETIIKIFRREQGSKFHETLQGYSDAFLQFLDANADLFPPELQEAWLEQNIRVCYRQIRRNLDDKVAGEIKRTGRADDQVTKRFAEETADYSYSRLSRHPLLDGLGKSFEARIRKRYLGLIRKIRKEIFASLPLSSDAQEKLDAIAVMFHSRKEFSEESPMARSGIVIAGFGSKDLYPCVETNLIGGVICDRVRKSRVDGKSRKMTYNGKAFIISFAQEDMVASFMRGMNTEVYEFLIDRMVNVFQDLPDLIDRGSLRGEDEEKDKTIDRYRKKTDALLKRLLDELIAHTNQEHVQPVMQMVAALPKNELAAMAENLVNLTAFKRRMARTTETVGGPVDVAVISKGDGFVWVKRKRYFPKELNHNFFANY